MIDIHCHILPNMDDGSKSWEDSLEMCRMAAKDGVTDIIATPHFGMIFYQYKVEDIRKVVRLLNSHLENQKIPLRVHSGADVALDAGALEWARRGDLPTLADGNRYFLLEPPDSIRADGLDQMIFDFKVMGLTPIITHPERMSVGKDWDWLERLLEMGCLCQITAMSITGGFGRPARKNALRLLEKGLVHFVASDAHSPRGRTPILSQAREELLDLVGPEQTLLLLKTAPQAVLDGQALDFPAPAPPARRSWFARLLG